MAKHTHTHTHIRERLTKRNFYVSRLFDKKIIAGNFFKNPLYAFERSRFPGICNNYKVVYTYKHRLKIREAKIDRIKQKKFNSVFLLVYRLFRLKILRKL